MSNYKEVAERFISKSETRKRYVKYMQIRWADTEERQCKTGYAQEWAERFENGDEVNCSDGIGQGILREMGE